MKKDKLEIVRGSGNVFRDLAYENADSEQFKAILAAAIIKKMDSDGLTARKAQSLTGVTEADFSRIRSVQLDRFTIDRLMLIVNRLGSRIDIAIKLRPGQVRGQHAPAV
jgi:predicted XRE-type DNA-binding protein